MYYNSVQNYLIKYTKDMTINNIIEMKQRDFKTLKRFETASEASKVLRSFFDKGFKSFDAFKAIVLFYDSEISEKRLYDFWHFKSVDKKMCERIINVFEKLKSE